MPGPLMAVAILLAASAHAQDLDCQWWTSDSPQDAENAWQDATVELVTKCLDAGADPNKRGTFRMTPFHWAVTYSVSPEVIKALLAGGADPSMKAKCVGNTASYILSGADSQLCRQWTALWYAAAYTENPAIVQTLIDAGVNPRKGFHKGSLGVAAALNEDPAVARVLIDAGADVNGKVPRGLPFAMLGEPY